MSQRTDRIAGEIQSALGEILSRQAIKDPRVRDAGLLTVTRIEVSGDLRHAKVLFTIFGSTDEVMQKAEEGLQHASAFLQREVLRRLRLRVAPQLHFQVDRGYAGAARVDVLFRTLEEERRSAGENKRTGGEAADEGSGEKRVADHDGPGDDGHPDRTGGGASPTPPVDQPDLPPSADPGGPGVSRG